MGGNVVSDGATFRVQRHTAVHVRGVGSFWRFGWPPLLKLYVRTTGTTYAPLIGRTSYLLLGRANFRFGVTQQISVREVRASRGELGILRIGIAKQATCGPASEASQRPFRSVAIVMSFLAAGLAGSSYGIVESESLSNGGRAKIYGGEKQRVYRLLYSARRRRAGSYDLIGGSFGFELATGKQREEVTDANYVETNGRFIYFLGGGGYFMLIVYRRTALIALDVFRRTKDSAARRGIARYYFRAMTFRSSGVVLASGLIGNGAVLLSRGANFSKGLAARGLRAIGRANVNVSYLIARAAFTKFREVFRVGLSLVRALMRLQRDCLYETFKGGVAPIEAILRCANLVVRQVRNFNGSYLAALRGSMYATMSFSGAIGPGLEVRVVEGLRSIRLGERRLKVAGTMRIRSLELRGLDRSAPVLLQIGYGGARTFAAFATGLYRFKRGTYNYGDLTKAKFSNGGTIRRFTLFGAMFGQYLVPNQEHPTFTKGRLTGVGISFFREQRYRLQGITCVHGRAAFKGAERVHMYHGFIEGGSYEVAMKFRSAAGTFLTIVHARDVRIVGRVILLFKHRIGSLWQAGRYFNVYPYKFHRSEYHHGALYTINHGVGVHRRYAIASGHLRRARVLRVGRYRGIFSFLVRPLVTLYVASDQSGARANDYTINGRATNTGELASDITSALYHTIALEDTNNYAPTLTNYVDHTVNVEVNLDYTITCTVETAAYLHEAGTITLTLKYAGEINVTSQFVIENSTVPIDSLANKPTFTKTSEEAHAPNFTITVECTTKVNLACAYASDYSS